MEQKGFPYEIWVVNDGSQGPDRPEIIEGLSKEVPVRLIHHEVNRGIGIAFLKRP